MSTEVLVERMAKMRAIYFDPHFAPKDQLDGQRRVADIEAAYGIEPISFSRKTHIYCGNGYLSGTAILGSLAYCSSRGRTGAVQTANAHIE